MSTQSTPPRNNTEELAKGGIISRRDLLKGALVGAGALAAMSLPTPLTRFLPAVAPREAMGANNNVADGIYLFRYNAAKEWSLSVPSGSSNWIPIRLNATTGSIAQCCAVTYDSSADAYRIVALCVFANYSSFSVDDCSTGTKVMSKTANSSQWIFKQNPNGSWSICNKGDSSLCINLADDNRSANATVQLAPYASDDITSQWELVCLFPAQTQSVTRLADASTVFNGSFLLKHARENYPEVVSIPSGWTVESKDGHPYLIKYGSGSVYRGSGAQSIVVKYSDVGDVGGIAVDFQAKIDVYPDYNDPQYDELGTADGWPEGTTVCLQWNDGDTGAKNAWGIFAGICVTSCSYYDVTYSCYDHSTGDEISLSGAYMTIASLNGGKLRYDQSSTRYETVSYMSSEPGVKAFWPYKSWNDVWFTGAVGGGTMRGVWMSANTGDFEDTIGGKDSDRAAMSFLVKDDAPTFRFASFATKSRNALWFYPTFTPLGILRPGAPEKSAKITS